MNIRCSKDRTEKTTIYYDLKSGKINTDRNHSGKGEGGIRRSKIHGQDRESIKLHLFIDRSSLELFINNGETVMTSRIYPDPSSVYVDLFAEEGEVLLLNLDAWKLASIWK
jgi:beta-fructofuranosidase